MNDSTKAIKTKWEDDFAGMIKDNYKGGYSIGDEIRIVGEPVVSEFNGNKYLEFPRENSQRGFSFGRLAGATRTGSRNWKFATGKTLADAFKFKDKSAKENFEEAIAWLNQHADKNGVISITCIGVGEDNYGSVYAFA